MSNQDETTVTIEVLDDEGGNVLSTTVEELGHSEQLWKRGQLPCKSTRHHLRRDRMDAIGNR
jgi:hypothetical protein